MGFNAIIDTREKEPWKLTASTIDEVISRKLDTGDYSIEGYEDKLCIERKRSVSELAANVSQIRFKYELERMIKIPYRFLVLEFSVQDILDYPVCSGIPQSRWKKLKVKGDYILLCLSQFQVKYGIHVVFAGNASNGAYLCTNIMKRVYERLYSDTEENS